jgi:hypothetical protein
MADKRKAVSQRQADPKLKGRNGAPKGSTNKELPKDKRKGARYDPELGGRVGTNGVVYPVCGAKRRSDGKPCRAFAGWKTGHPGYGACKAHGGTLPSHERKWARVQAEEELLAMTATLGAPIEVAPAQALLWCVHITAGHVAWLHARIGETPEDQIMEPETRGLLALYNGERERLAKFSKMATDAGANEALVRWTASQANALISVSQEALSAIPNLTKDQVDDFFRAVAQGLGALEGMSPEEVTSRFNPSEAPTILPAPKRNGRRKKRHKIADDPRRVVPHDPRTDP